MQESNLRLQTFDQASPERESRGRAPRMEQCIPDLQKLTHGQRQTVMVAAGLFVVWVLALLVLTRPLFCLVIFVLVCCCCAPGQLAAAAPDQQQREADDENAKELGRALAEFADLCADRLRDIH